MPLIGLTLDRTTHQLPAEQLSNLVTKIERLGFESVWLLDSFGREPFLACGFMLSRTSTLKVATGVATVYGRDPTGAVQALQTLSEFYPGRFIMGLGASNPIVIAKRKGEWVAPLPKMTSYLEEMADVKLISAMPERMAPLYIAAHAPGLQNLATKHAQGMVTWMMPNPVIKEARERVGAALNITSQILCVMTSDANEARSVARAYLAMYLALPYYQTAFAKAGFDPSDWSEGGSDRLIDSITAWGSTSDILARVEEFGNAGADRVVLNVVHEDETQRVVGKPPVIIGDWEGIEALSAIIREKQ
ncbi:LLM class F420-dependent oxidoreductase (plasmid) [Paraburkholderia sp. PGU19]|uniref:LLM class flavin-dependent oxidoreductase n=1 Tax=Paraburkholderia sp. PGU19 TaxID=2735434 RepID=UPI0015DA8E21|nr:LLM class flavin-dependent oxidoreductase [Paraburkholderia sp. PGU19]BCG04936.1 LLM class F420-dependent oxidoreductase [Paraburkholderia sp. PGU19]